jgi:hypothetical protein
MARKFLFGLALFGTLGASALMGTASAQTGFAWACQPTTASYDAIASCSPYVYNSRGEGVQIHRSGTGVYQVDFGGLGGRTIAGGNVQVTAYLGGSTAINVICNSVSWSSGGTDFIANVRCVKGSTPADSRFNILVGWFGQ